MNKKLKVTSEMVFMSSWYNFDAPDLLQRLFKSTNSVNTPKRVQEQIHEQLNAVLFLNTRAGKLHVFHTSHMCGEQKNAMKRETQQY